MEEKTISIAALHRLPGYLNYLKSLPQTVETISATAIAAALGLGQVQVRKDLAFVSSSGKPKIGYSLPLLTKELEAFLGFCQTDYAVVVGSSALGKALAQDGCCAGYGFHIIAAFDNSPQTEETHPISSLTEFCRKNQIQVGILSSPPVQAQALCDYMIEAGIRVIINLTSAHLQVPSTVAVSQQDIAASIALFSKAILHNSE